MGTESFPFQHTASITRKVRVGNKGRRFSLELVLHGSDGSSIKGCFSNQDAVQVQAVTVQGNLMVKSVRRTD